MVAGSYHNKNPARWPGFDVWRRVVATSHLGNVVPKVAQGRQALTLDCG